MEKDQQNCLNCGAHLPIRARYCPMCSQKVTDGRESIGSILNEFFESLFNVDNRFFRTIAHLFIPGKLTIAYFSGKHKSYVHPIRLLLVSAVLLIAILGFLIGDADLDMGDTLEEWQSQEWTEEFVAYSDSIRQLVQSDFPQPEAVVAVDTFYQAIERLDSVASDSVKIPFSVMSFSNEDKLRYSRHDLLTMKPKDLIEKYGSDKPFWIKLKNQQEVRFIQSGLNVVEFALGNITWQALLALPIVALFMRLLYFRRDFYYVEHLIFSIHNTSLFFFALIFMVLLDDYIHNSIPAVLLLLVLIYLFISMKRFYQQVWWKTLIKYFIALTAYTTILSIAGLIVIVISFFLV